MDRLNSMAVIDDDLENVDCNHRTLASFLASIDWRAQLSIDQTHISGCDYVVDWPKSFDRIKRSSGASRRSHRPNDFWVSKQNIPSTGGIECEDDYSMQLYTHMDGYRPFSKLPARRKHTERDASINQLEPETNIWRVVHPFPRPKFCRKAQKENGYWKRRSNSFTASMYKQTRTY